MITALGLLSVYKLALPLAISNLIIFASSAIDYFFIGRLGERELAAASLAFNLYFFIKILGDGVVLAIISILGKLVEGENYQAATKVMFNCLVAMSIFSMLAFPMLLAGERLLLFLEQPPGLVELTFPLFSSLAYSLLPSFLFSMLVTYLSVLHSPSEVFKQSVLFLMGKLIIGYYLFSILELRFSSVGLSTTLCSIICIVQGCVKLHRSGQLVFKSSCFEIHGDTIKKVLAIGTPIGLLELSTIASTMAAAFFMSPFGESAIAANALAVLSIEIVIVLMFGFSDASAILVSKSFSPAQARRNIVAVVVAGLGFSICLLVILLVFKKNIPVLFLSDTPGSIQTFELTNDFIEIGLFLFVFDSVGIILRGVMQGLGETGKQLVICLIGNWPIGLGSGLILAHAYGFGSQGIWYGMAVGHLFTFSGMVVLVLRRNREQPLEQS